MIPSNLRPPRGFLFDLEGTLHVGDEPVSGAAAAIARLHELGVPVRFLTNTTRFSRSELVRRLQSMGFPLSEDHLFTAPRAAADWLRSRGFSRVMLCIPQSTHSDFADFEIVGKSPEVVVVGDLGSEWSFELLNKAFNALVDGAILLALQKNRYWKSPGGLALDAGPFVVALEYAAEVEAVLVGKPAVDFFALAGAALGMAPADIVVVGDDIDADIGGAQNAGMRGVLVRTGKFRPEVLMESAIVPDAVAESVPELVKSWFGD